MIIWTQFPSTQAVGPVTSRVTVRHDIIAVARDRGNCLCHGSWEVETEGWVRVQIHPQGYTSL